MVFARSMCRVSGVPVFVHFLVVAALLLCPAVSAQTDADREAANIIGVDEPLNMLDKVKQNLTDKVNSIKNFFTKPKDSDPYGQNSAELNESDLVGMGEKGRRKGVEDCVKKKATTLGDQSNRKFCEGQYLLSTDSRTRPPEQAERPDLEVAEPAERQAPPGQSASNDALKELELKNATNSGNDKFFSDRLLASCNEGQLTDACTRYLQRADEVAATAATLQASPYFAQLLPFQKKMLTVLRSPTLAAAIRERRANPVATGCKQVTGEAVKCAPAEETVAATPPTLLRRGSNAGATLFQQSIGETEERERQAKADAELLALATTNPRAYDNECMARSNRISANTQENRAILSKNLYQGLCSKASQARAQILEANKVIAAAANERELEKQAQAAQAAQRAKEAGELAAAIGKLIVTAAQVSAATSTPDPVAAPSGGNRQQQAALQAAPQARPAANASQGPVHNPANSAMQCISTFQEKTPQYK